VAVAPIDTIENVRLWVLGNSADTSQDALLNLISADVTGAFQDYTHRQLSERLAFTERHHGRNTPFLFPFDAPINAVSSLQLVDPDGDVLIQDLAEGPDFVIAPSKEYIQLRFLEERRGITGRFLPRFPAGENNIKMVYDSGFAAADMPPGVKLAFRETVRMYFSLRKPGSGTPGMKSERISKYAYTRQEAAAGSNPNSGLQLTQEARSALNPWIRPWMRFTGRDLTPNTVTRSASEILP
jgi:hypothetical protein